MLDHFMSKVSPEPNSGCWLWMGGVSSRGYGCFIFDGRQRQAHHFSYIYFNGPIPEGNLVRHKCDVRCCVNPAHLLVGTQADNVRDRGERNRTARGTRYSIAKLTDDKVRYIRASNLKQRELATLLGVSRATVGKARAGTSWRHV